MEWCQWCRLCGKENGSEVNIFIKEENSYSIAETIHQLLSIQINNFDDMPKNICLICNDFLASIQTFSEKARKIEEMFLEIDFDYKNGHKVETFDVRVKYGLEYIVNRKSKRSENIENNIYSEFSDKSANTSPNTKFEDTLNSTAKVNVLSISQNYDKSIPHCIENLKHFSHATNVSSHEMSLDDKMLCDSVTNEVKHESEDLEPLDPDDLNSDCKLKKRFKKTFTQNEKKLECEECHMKFVRESNYAYHLKKVHNVIKQILPCNICGKVCKTKQKLKFHMELHLPPEEREKLLFKCPECPQKFTQNGAMRSHVRAQHYFEKPFICEQCGKKFSSQTNLWSHRRSHDDKNHLTCPKCPKVFKNKFRLRVHMRGHNDSCHPCSICGLILKTMNTLKNHMLVHSDAKPFKCNFCGKDFKRDKNLQNHMITHSGLRPFICRFCGQSYANRSNCKKHEKHSHPQEYETAASLTNSEPQQKVVKKLPNIQQLEAMLEQIKSDKISTNDE